MKSKLIATVLLAGGLMAAEQRFDMKVRNYFFAAFSGDMESFAKGMKICEDILAENPRDPEALVWHGSGLFFQSRQSFQQGDQQKGMELWTRGLNEMDTAVEISPDSVGIRIPRGAVLLTASHYVPADMAKPLIEKGVIDYEKAYEIQGPDLSTLGTHPRGELLIGLAEGYNRLGNQEKARAWFERIQKEMKGTPYAKSATAWLETKSLAPAQAGCLGCHSGK